MSIFGFLSTSESCDSNPEPEALLLRICSENQWNYLYEILPLNIVKITHIISNLIFLGIIVLAECNGYAKNLVILTIIDKNLWAALKKIRLNSGLWVPGPGIIYF